MERPPLSTALWRGATLRCARCGSRHLFRWWLSMVPDCPRCELHFEREPGYWLGSMTINIGATMVVFFAVFIGTMVVTWPDVPWDALWVITVGAMVITPMILHPFSRTLWIAAERHARALSDGEY